MKLIDIHKEMTEDLLRMLKHAKRNLTKYREKSLLCPGGYRMENNMTIHNINLLRRKIKYQHLKFKEELCEEIQLSRHPSLFQNH